MAFPGARFWHAGAVDQPGSGCDHRPAARFAEIVDAGPEKLPGVFRVVAHKEPTVAVVAVFGADDDARRLGALRGEQFVVAIICSDHVEQIGEAVVVIVADVGPKQRLRDRARRIGLVHHLHQLGENRLGKYPLGRVVNFVAGAVKNDAGMIAVAADGVARVGLRPFVEIEMIVVRIFGDGPAVEDLVHHQKAHAVA